MSIEEKIKGELINEINSDIDKIYDFMSIRFKFEDETHDKLIKVLNSLKDDIYLLAKDTKLS